MKTGYEELDKIIKLDKQQLVLITSEDNIEDILALNLVKNMAIDEKIKTAIFTYLDLADEEEQFKIYTKDILTSICSTVDINKIIDSRYLKTILPKDELEMVKTKGKAEVLFDKDNGQKLYITKEMLNNEEEKRVKESYRKIDNAPLYINEVQEITINQFEEKCRKTKEEKDLQLIVSSTTIIKDDKVNIFKTLKELAKELNVLILVTTPTIEMENNNISLKREVKELGEIMNIVDITIYLKLGNEQEKGIVHYIVDTPKNRNIIDMAYLEEYYKFVNIKTK